MALEDKVREQGLTRIALHVFRHNEGARALYRRSGYVEKGITMTKELQSTGRSGMPIEQAI